MTEETETKPWRDPIVAEVREVREALFAAAGHDVHEFCRGLREREAASGADHGADITALKTERQETADDLAALEKRWGEERELVKEVRELRSKLEEAHRAEAGAADGKGNVMIGSANLTDKVWLHGSSEQDIIATISGGRSDRMPAHKELLSDTKINLLTAYVLSLSRGDEKR